MVLQRTHSSQPLEFERDIHIDVVLPRLSGANGEQVLHKLAESAAGHLPVSAAHLYQALKAQESPATGGGEGVAIPVVKLAELTETVVVLACLDRPQDLGAPDGKPVDLICLLCSPQEQGALYLRRLSRLTRLFKNRDLCEKIRAAGDPETIKNLIHNPEGWMLAA